MRLSIAFLLSLTLHGLLWFWLLPSGQDQGGDAVVSVTPTALIPNVIMPLTPAVPPGELTSDHCITNLQLWLIQHSDDDDDSLPPASILGNLQCAATLPKRLDRSPTLTNIAAPSVPVTITTPPALSSPALPKLTTNRRDQQRARFLAELKTAQTSACQAAYEMWLAANTQPTLDPAAIPESLRKMDCSAQIDLATRHQQALIDEQRTVVAEKARQLAQQQAEEAARAEALRQAQALERQQEAHAEQQALALEHLTTQRTLQTATPSPPSDPNAGKSDQQLIEEALARQAARKLESAAANPGNSGNRDDGDGDGSKSGNGQQGKGQSGRNGSGSTQAGMGGRGTQPSADRPVQILSSAQPRYPADDKRRGHEGVVTLRAQISATGKISNITVVQSSGFPGLDEAAQATLRRYRFAPAIINGQPATSTVQKSIIFQLR